jgi:hypothetical protein
VGRRKEPATELKKKEKPRGQAARTNERNKTMKTNKSWLGVRTQGNVAMKRNVLWIMYVLGAIALALMVNTAPVRQPAAAVRTAHNPPPAGSRVGLPTTASQSALPPASGFSPCLASIPSRPVVPGKPAVSLAPDGTTFGPWHAYEPADICAAYDVDRLQAKGITGKGQTIVVVVSYGSPTALQDLQAFSQAFGLPTPDLTII